MLSTSRARNRTGSMKGQNAVAPVASNRSPIAYARARPPTNEPPSTAVFSKRLPAIVQRRVDDDAAAAQFVAVRAESLWRNGTREIGSHRHRRRQVQLARAEFFLVFGRGK